jgi:hypothetical protein
MAMDGAALSPGEVLKALAAEQLLRKAGAQFPDAEVTPEAFSGACGKSLPDAARRDLELIFSGIYRGALPEFVGLLEQHAVEWPPDFLPEALDLCVQHKAVQNYLFPVLEAPGSRARWLAGRRTDWSALFVGEDFNWPVAGFRERLPFFAKMRKENPRKALELLSSTWSEEAAEHRVAFLECLTIRRSVSDVPFLEQAISDRSREVRWLACRLLSLLPGNRVHEAIGQAAAACLRVWPAIHSGAWWQALTPFVDSSKTLTEDDLRERVLSRLPVVLSEAMAAHPSPSVFLEEAAHLQLAGALLEGIAWHADQRLQIAVVHFLDQHPDHELRRDPALSKVLTSMTDADWNQAMAWFVRHPPLWNNPQNSITTSLLQEQRPWSRALVAGLLYQIALKIQQPFAFPAPPLPQLLECAAYQCDVSEGREIAGALPEFARISGAWKQHLERFHSILRFRAAMQFHFRNV